MLESVEQVCNNLPHFGTIQPEGKEIEIWAKPYFFNQTNKEDYHKAGIYCIENFRLNKIYIGMSKDVATRINTHRRELNPRTNIVHHNREMYKDSVDYGFHNFSFGIIETFDDDVSREFLLMREEEWIRYYENQSENCLYNKNRCSKYDNISDNEYEQLPVVEKQEAIIELGHTINPFKETKDIVKSVRITESMNNKIMEANVPLVEIIERGLSCSKNPTEKFPIDYLIQDVLQMKVEAHNIQNDKLFYFADYLERRLFEFKKGEIEFTREVPR